METDWTQWAPIPGDLPELDAETLAAVRELQGGEINDSTRHLFTTFESQLGAYFRRHSCQDHEADDLTQTVFIRMLEQVGTLKDPTRFHFWLFKIARHHLFNFTRDAARDREGLEIFADKARQDREADTFWARGTFEPSPEARLTVSEAADRRRDVLAKLLKTTRLKPRTRRSLLLRLRGASYQEIARELEISVGTVGSHISRASAALLRNLEKVDLDAVTLDTDDAALVASLTPELLTFKREAMEADPAYYSAGTLEGASADYEGAQASDDEAPRLLDTQDAEDERRTIVHAVDSPAEIAAVVRQDRRRGRPRRRSTRTILPAGERNRQPALGRISRGDLSYPLILLQEVAARCARAFDPLALKAKLTCAGSLLARGRRFGVARRAEESVRLAIVLIGNGRSGDINRDASRREQIRHRVAEGRGLLQSYLGRS